MAISYFQEPHLKDEANVLAFPLVTSPRVDPGYFYRRGRGGGESKHLFNKAEKPFLN